MPCYPQFSFWIPIAEYYDLLFLHSHKPGPSASTGEHCICIVSDLLLGLVWGCFVFCLLFLLFYVICAPVLTEGTHKPRKNTSVGTILKHYEKRSLRERNL